VVAFPSVKHSAVFRCIRRRSGSEGRIRTSTIVVWRTPVR
jgi:hypothetical protein